MGTSNCAVIKCYNNKRKLDKWKEIEYNIHAGITPVHSHLDYFAFLDLTLYQDRCEKRTGLSRRRTIVSNTKLHPKPSDRVYSDHFLGYNIVQTSSRRELFRQPLAKKKKHLNISNEPIPLLVDDESVQCCSSSTLTSPPPPLPSLTSPVSASTFFSPMSSEHSYGLPPNKRKCLACIDKNKVIASMANKMSRF